MIIGHARVCHSPKPGAIPSLFRDHERGEMVVDDDAGRVMRSNVDLASKPANKSISMLDIRRLGGGLAVRGIDQPAVAVELATDVIDGPLVTWPISISCHRSIMTSVGTEVRARADSGP
jgi:hypothetical protein